MAHRAEIERAHARAVAVALDHIEASVPLLRRRVRGVITHERAAGLVVARFRHHTSRQAADRAALGLAADPQLHDHCVVANMALRAEGAAAVNGRWAAIDSRELFRVTREGGAVYRAELAAEMGALGYSIRRVKRNLEVRGVSDRVRAEFSSRTAEVDRATARFIAVHGRAPTLKEADALVVMSRLAKGEDEAPAFAQWRERAAALGLDVLARETLRVGGMVELDLDAAAAVIVAELCEPRGERGLVVSSAVASERELRIAVAEAAQGRVRGAHVERLIARVCQSSELVALDGEGRQWTTRAMLEAEGRVIDRALGMANSRGERVSSRAVGAAIAGARVTLSAEQCRAVRAVVDGGRLRLLTAPAGAGKGEVLRVAAAAVQREGWHVVALAAAGETAQRLGAEIGADETRTVDSFVNRATRLEEMGIEPDSAVESRTVVVVDEAALLETWRWDALLAVTGEAVVIAAGDGAQLSPIEAGGLWSVLDERLGSAVLTENFRAQEEWARDAWSALRHGASVGALRAFEERGLVSVSETRDESRMAAVAAWDRDRSAVSSAEAVDGYKGIERFLLLCDSSNHDVDALNLLAQERRLVAGELGEEVLTVRAQDHAGRPREENIHAGDVVTFEKQVYPRGERARIENGASATVLSVDAEHGRAVVDVSGRTITLEGDQVEALRLGYAQHVYSAQGRTVDHTYVVTGGWQTDRERSYVAVSRSRVESRVFVDYSSLEVKVGERDAALRELSRRVGESRPKVAATSVLERAGREVPVLESVGVVVGRVADEGVADRGLERVRLRE